MAEFEPIRALTELVDQNALLESNPWLTSKRLAAWERSNKIRCYRPRQNTRLYVEGDIIRAIEEEMSCAGKKAPSNTGTSGSAESPDEKAGIDAGTMTEAEKLHAEASERRLLSKPKRS